MSMLASFPLMATASRAIRDYSLLFTVGFKHLCADIGSSSIVTYCIYLSVHIF
jgi:hypothetical protein